MCLGAMTSTVSGKVFQNLSVNFEKNFLFPLPGAPADKHRLGRLEAQELLHPCFNRRVGLRGEKIVLCVAVDFYSLGIRTHIHDSMGVLFSDHAEGVDVFQDITKKRPEREILPNGSRRNPCHGSRRMGFLCGVSP